MSKTTLKLLLKNRCLKIFRYLDKRGAITFHIKILVFHLLYKFLKRLIEVKICIITQLGLKVTTFKMPQFSVYKILKYFFLKRYIQKFTKILLSWETHQRPIGDPSETDMFGNPSETSTCFIGDRHASSKTHRKPTCLTRDPSATDMPDRRPRHVSSETHLKPTCLIKNLPEIDMPDKESLHYCKIYK